MGHFPVRYVSHYQRVERESIHSLSMIVWGKSWWLSIKLEGTPISDKACWVTPRPFLIPSALACLDTGSWIGVPANFKASLEQSQFSTSHATMIKWTNRIFNCRDLWGTVAKVGVFLFNLTSFQQGSAPLSPCLPGTSYLQSLHICRSACSHWECLQNLQNFASFEMPWLGQHN